MKHLKSALIVFAILMSKQISAGVYLDPADRDDLNQKFSKISLQALKASGGADIVGNGGGAVEQAAVYIYRSLDRYISLCLNIRGCVVESEKREILKQIRDVIVEKRDEKNRLVFLSGDNFKSYMQDDLDPEIRVAKTGFSADFPIFINLEEAYTYPKESLYSSFAALFVHEVGHQIGVASHSYLDELAARVRETMEANTKELTYEVLTGEFSFTLFSGVTIYDFDQFLLQYNSQRIETPSLREIFKCQNGDKLVGANLSNIYWDKSKTIDYKFIMGLNGWGEFYCERKGNKTIYLEEKNVQIVWKFTVQILPAEYYIFLLDEVKVNLK